MLFLKLCKHIWSVKWLNILLYCYMKTNVRVIRMFSMGDQDDIISSFIFVVFRFIVHSCVQSSGVVIACSSFTILISYVLIISAMLDKARNQCPPTIFNRVITLGNIDFMENCNVIVSICTNLTSYLSNLIRYPYQ